MANITELADGRFCIQLTCSELALLHCMAGCTHSYDASYFDPLQSGFYNLDTPKGRIDDVGVAVHRWYASFSAANIAWDEDNGLSLKAAGKPPEPSCTLVSIDDAESDYELELECSKEEFFIIFAPLVHVVFRDSSIDEAEAEAEALWGDAKKWRKDIQHLALREFTAVSVIEFKN